MARLTYSAIASLDGVVAERNGRFDWAAPTTTQADRRMTRQRRQQQPMRSTPPVTIAG